MTSTVAEPTGVRKLLDRTDVTEVLYRVARAMDTRDWDLFARSFTADAQGDYGSSSADGRAEILAMARAFLEALDVTQHLLGNVEVSVEGDTATTRATFIAQHVRDAAEGDGQLLMGGTYVDTFRRSQDGWQITHRRIRGLWSNGNPAVLGIPLG
ncbi:nuclear transport factor 2 family protein [Kineosporia succinea]|uniref:3-phenylpropionate/cinnamic acid dioxygenase small subunit n=1 Tax=Kineosporia succinea TaxID=84632 RepID=A0ABT9PCD9_9ACTN|nr:nuclear transport factor 2 family protein [Kineosporia succinea]MDP9830377.1 3-phenylpropionate/cinnamic acid dioxygenase small subunit [Kineosporia succinea]